jgi:hypothetical protein
MNTKTYTIYDTSVLQSINGYELANTVAKFLLNNPNCIYPPNQYSNFLKNSLIDTPINLLFKRLISMELLKYTTAVVIAKGVSNIPELLTYTTVPIDIKPLPTASAFQSKEYLHDKTIINITPFLKIQKDGELPYPSDLNNIHASFVRASIVQSYHDFSNNSTMWLTMPLSTYIIKSFTTVISSIITKFYMLDITERVNISFPLALYMASLLTSDYNTTERLFCNCTYLGNSNTLHEYFDTYTYSKYNNTNFYITMPELCTMIRDIGPSRMHNFDPDIYIRLVRTISSDVLGSLIAIECPAFWVYMLVSSVSNTKMRLYFELKNNKLLEETKKFTHNFIYISNYTDFINR